MSINIELACYADINKQGSSLHTDVENSPKYIKLQWQGMKQCLLYAAMGIKKKNLCKDN